MFADRMSTETMRANQLRLYLSSLAYGLVVGLRRLGLAGTRWARAQTETIRRVLLKVGAPVRGTVRKIWVSMASGYAYIELFGEVYEALRPPREKPLATFRRKKEPLTLLLRTAAHAVSCTNAADRLRALRKNHFLKKMSCQMIQVVFH